MTIPNNTRRPTSHIAPFGVRMPPELKERLEQIAAASDRSLNAEIVQRLQRSLENEAAPHSGVAAAMPLSLNYDELVSALLRQARENDEQVIIQVTKQQPAPRGSKRAPSKK